MGDQGCVLVEGCAVAVHRAFEERLLGGKGEGEGERGERGRGRGRDEREARREESAEREEESDKKKIWETKDACWWKAVQWRCTAPSRRGCWGERERERVREGRGGEGEGETREKRGERRAQRERKRVIKKRYGRPRMRVGGRLCSGGAPRLR